jgi:endonuclease/exonuclease/phosphatase family metal-dependent hydrolase
LTWAGPGDPDHRRPLSDWCRSVGPALVSAPRLDPVDVSRVGLLVTTWNVHEGFGDLERFLRSLPRGPALIVLLQEVARAGSDVPADVPGTVRTPERIGPSTALRASPRDGSDRDIAAIASAFEMSMVYVPSMRNGPASSREDRGSAILSTLPLSDIVGIELPWVAQRRVAVMATATGTSGGAPWRLRIVDVHLDNRLRRSRQATALAAFLARLDAADAPLLVGGDFNAWFGAADPAVKAIDRIVPRVRECGDAPTFRFGRRLDHLFTTLPGAARAGCEVQRDRFGSDHRALTLHLFSDGSRTRPPVMNRR